jgi:hypothetical protein
VPAQGEASTDPLSLLLTRSRPIEATRIPSRSSASSMVARCWRYSIWRVRMDWSSVSYAFEPLRALKESFADAPADSLP